MKVKDVMNMSKVSALSNLPISRNDDALIIFVNLGVSELFRRFNMSIKIETVETTPDLALYELRNKDVSLILSIYNSNAQELRTTDVLGGDYDYKLVNYKSFIIKYPKHDLIFVSYKASSPTLSIDSDVPLPDAMIDALLTYIAYMGHSTINRDNINEASAYQKRFEDACDALDMQGFRIPLNNESIALQVKGYI